MIPLVSDLVLRTSMTTNHCAKSMEMRLEMDCTGEKWTGNGQLPCLYNGPMPKPCQQRNSPRLHAHLSFLPFKAKWSLSLTVYVERRHDKCAKSRCSGQADSPRSSLPIRVHYHHIHILDYHRSVAYPCGCLVCQFHRSLHISSSV